MSNHQVAVGAPGESQPGQSGTVFVFTNNGNLWDQTAEIVAADYQADDFFGGAVSLDGDRLAIGSPGADFGQVNSGAVYLFKFDGFTWNLEQKIRPQVPITDEYFGHAVKLQNDRLLIGTSNVQGIGAAYVFELETDLWNEKQKIVSSDIEPNDLFGFSIDMHGDRIIVGARRHDTFNGAAYIFDYDGIGWVEQAKLMYDKQFGSDGFGYAVSISGDTAMVSATQHETSGGAVYVFELINEEWQRIQKLDRMTNGAFHIFGFNIDLQGDLAVIGAPRYAVNLIEYGAAYVFKKVGGQWIPIAFVREINSGDGDRFGQSISLGEGQVSIGAMSSNLNGDTSGAAYVVDFDEHLIFKNGYNPSLNNCLSLERPTGVSPVNGKYRHYNGGFNFAESTNSVFLARVETNQYLTLSDFTFPTQDARRRINFSDAPSNENLMAIATISVSECPGDFTTSATCSMQVSNSSTAFFSTRDSDAQNSMYCVLDPEKNYFFNLIMTPEPFVIPPECDEPSATNCAAFYNESVMN